MVVAATLVTVTTLLLSAVGAWDYVIRRDEEMSRLKKVTAGQTDELAVALSLPAWNIDRPQIDKIIDSQASAPFIEAIVVNVAGQVQARVRDPRRRFIRSDGRVAGKGLLVESRPILHGAEEIGSVRLYTTDALVRRLLRAELNRKVVMILGIDALLIFVIYLVIFRTVLKPIVEIERYAGAVSALGDPPPLNPAPTAELESLRASIESMVNDLRRSEERFRAIFESVNDAIFIHDRETGAILDVNPRMTELFGYSREEARQLDLSELASGQGPFNPDRAKELISGSRPGDRQLFEWHTRDRDGRLFWVEVSIRSAMIDGMERVVAVVRDVHQRKDMEEALRRSETMSAMGALVAGVAHEVRNPLFGMSALIDAYADEMTTPDLAHLAGALREQIGRLSRLMRELLELGRPVPVIREPGLLADVVRDAVSGRARAAAEAGVTLTNSVNGDLPPIGMDTSRLAQVFENLIDNAVQHAPAVRNVHIAAKETVHAERTWIECTVEDDGRGFRDLDLEHVFEPFFTRREGGIGLGMPIVRRIVEEHGGRVVAGNRPEGGAVVTVRLPLN
jgi:PAS domain S-box-containing protein